MDHRQHVGADLLGSARAARSAILAAQSDYATNGAFAELLRIYNLLGDPAMSLQ